MTVLVALEPPNPVHERTKVVSAVMDGLVTLPLSGESFPSAVDQPPPCRESIQEFPSTFVALQERVLVVPD